MIDRDEQWRLSQSVDRIAKCTQLLAAPIVAREQNDASDARVAQHFSLDLIELDTRDADHEGSERHDHASGMWSQTISRASRRPSDAASRCSRLLDTPSNFEIDEAGHRKRGQPAGIDSSERRKIEVDVDRDPVERATVAYAKSYRRNLAGLPHRHRAHLRA